MAGKPRWDIEEAIDADAESPPHRINGASHTCCAGPGAVKEKK